MNSMEEGAAVKNQADGSNWCLLEILVLARFTGSDLAFSGRPGFLPERCWVFMQSPGAPPAEGECQSDIFCEVDFHPGSLTAQAQLPAETA